MEIEEIDKVINKTYNENMIDEENFNK